MTIGTPWRGLLAGTVVLALVVGGWFALTDRALDRVSVTAGDWRCTGTSLVRVRVDGRGQQAPRMVPGMRCRRRLAVHNGAGRGATLDSVVVPSLGSVGAPGVRVTSIDGRSPRPGEDARVDIGQHLAGDASTTVVLVAAFRPDGCTPAGGFQAEPAVTLTLWGRSREIASRTPLAFAGTPASDCLGRLPGG